MQMRRFKRKWMVVRSPSGAEHKFLLSDGSGNVRHVAFIEVEGSVSRRRAPTLTMEPIQADQQIN